MRKQQEQPDWETCLTHFDVLELPQDRPSHSPIGGRAHCLSASVALLRGLEALQLQQQEMPRNCAREDCGWCGLGCARGAKQDTTSTFLADAAGQGCVILAGVLSAGC